MEASLILRLTILTGVPEDLQAVPPLKCVQLIHSALLNQLAQAAKPVAGGIFVTSFTQESVDCRLI